MDVDTILAQIRAERLKQGIKQSEIARRMGVSNSFVQSLEYRKGIDRRWGTILAYAEAVGVTIHVTVGEHTE